MTGLERGNEMKRNETKQTAEVIRCKKAQNDRGLNPEIEPQTSLSVFFFCFFFQVPGKKTVLSSLATEQRLDFFFFFFFYPTTLSGTLGTVKGCVLQIMASPPTTPPGESWY